MRTPPARAAGRRAARVAAAAPWVFVVLWSTGFVVARFGTDDADPLAFLAVRLGVAALVLACVATATRAPRPDAATIGWAALAGLGLHAVYLGGVFVAVSWGMPSGVSALIAGLQPVVVAVAGHVLLGERVVRRQWLGVALGFGGVSLVVVERMASAAGGGVTAAALAASFLSLAGIVGGTLVQRRRGVGMPLLWGTVVQYVVSAVALAAGALVMGWRFSVTLRSVLALAWAVVVLSFAAVLIMLWLLQRHAAARVSSLFFLTPALSTVEGALLFGERLGPAAVGGLAAALAGVALTLRTGRAQGPS